MKDFFSRQEDARRRSARLVVLFCLAVVAVALGVYLAALLIYLWSSQHPPDTVSLWHPRLFLWTAGSTLLFITVGSLWKMQELRAGGVRIAELLGGRPVPARPEDPREQQLRNVVEEMAIASGVPVPDIYLLEQERAINACAAGNELSDAVICITRGALELLDRNELQGVVAHEFSHIINGDMRLNLHLLGWLNGMLLIGQAGETVLRGLRRARGKGAGIIILFGAALYIIGYIGYFFGRLIRCAVSRQREYLGDAAAAQFTRFPEGLAGALKKIGGLASGSQLDHPRAGEVSHLFFSNCLEESWLHALDTHPPLAERIQLLDPRFNGMYPDVTPLPAPPILEAYTKPLPRTTTSPAAAMLNGAAVMSLLEHVGEPLREHIERARLLIAALPYSLNLAARDPFGAFAVVCGLVLQNVPAVRVAQDGIIAALPNKALAGEIGRLAPEISGLAPEARLPLLELTVPALRSLSHEQYHLLKATVDQLSRADGTTSIFEFTVRYLLLRHLEPRFTQRPHQTTQVYGVRGVQEHCARVLSIMARIGHQDEASARQAFERGVLLFQGQQATLEFLPGSACGVLELEQSFTTLESASPQIKRRLLAGCMESLIHDGTVTVAEFELFRAITDAVGCPVPPWLETAQAVP
jgi:Zn-dependent protease with chaperone function